MINNRLLATLLFGVTAVLTACTSADLARPAPRAGSPTEAAAGPAAPTKPYQPSASKGSGKPAREYQITSQVASAEIVPGKKTQVWTYNGQLPGPVLRVTQGDLLRVTYRNELPEQSTIHWHGVNGVDNSQDGVAGVTQNAVKPDETYFYEFAPPAAGTFWYHSHQNATEQVDMGLGGILVVEPRTPRPEQRTDQEVTLLLDEYVLDASGLILPGEDARHGAGTITMMAGDMNAPGGGMRDMSDVEFSGYNTFTINGRTSANVSPIDVSLSQMVRLRIVNAGTQKHLLHLHGHRYRLEALDATPINEPYLTDAAFPVVPGERVDVAFVADNPGTWLLHSHDADPDVDSGQSQRLAKREQMAVAIRYAGSPSAPTDADRAAPSAVPELDLLAYGKPGAGLGFDSATRFDRSYTLDIGMTMAMGGQPGTDNDHGGMPGMSKPGGMGNPSNRGGMGQMSMSFSVNGKAFPNTDPLPVKSGERVKATLVNNSPISHPMHLHGQPFQVLSVDGRAPSGSALVRDVVEVRPVQRVEIGFLANNPGIWMFHCHILPHASSGLTVAIPYEGYAQPFAADPTPGFNVGE